MNSLFYKFNAHCCYNTVNEFVTINDSTNQRSSKECKFLLNQCVRKQGISLIQCLIELKYLRKPNRVPPNKGVIESMLSNSPTKELMHPFLLAHFNRSPLNQR